jgi:hypothetical protein
MGAGMILLFTDFGYDGPYVGQMKAVLASQAPDATIIDLMHDAPPHDPRAAAYLLASLVREMPAGAICLAVVDPGVGGARPPMIVEADNRWFVGPGNGLFEIVSRRASFVRHWRIDWRPDRLAPSFHGRDLFAPVAACLAQGETPARTIFDWARDPARPGADWPDDSFSVIHIDRFGNAATGIRAVSVGRSAVFAVGRAAIGFARVFSEVPPGQVFWYENAAGLVEIAVNCGRAADVLGLSVGDNVSIPV